MTVESGEHGTGEWSVVMTGSRLRESQGEQADSDLREFARSAPYVFEFALFDLYLLATGPADDLPAELRSGLDHAEAERLVDQLSAVGVEAEVARTAELRAVRHRVRDLLPDYEDEEWVLSVVEGLVICSSPMTGRRQVRNWREHEPDVPGWCIEDYLNHAHTGGWTFEEELEDSVAQAKHLIEVLGATYPGRAFTVARDSCRVSFWQTTPETPRTAAEWTGSPENEGMPQDVFCYNCQKKRPYHPIPDLDPNWPSTQWGRCDECGHRVPVRNFAAFTFIGPGANQPTADSSEPPATSEQQ